jgi:hypothetical protein
VFTAAQWARLRALLAVPGDWPDAKVPDALSVVLDAQRVVGEEFDYLADGARLGYVHGHWQIDDVPPPPADGG